jgi:hypothetical protein
MKTKPKSATDCTRTRPVPVRASSVAKSLIRRWKAHHHEIWMNEQKRNQLCMDIADRLKSGAITVLDLALADSVAAVGILNRIYECNAHTRALDEVHDLLDWHERNRKRSGHESRVTRHSSPQE